MLILNFRAFLCYLFAYYVSKCMKQRHAVLSVKPESPCSRILMVISQNFVLVHFPTTFSGHMNTSLVFSFVLFFVLFTRVNNFFFS